MRLTRRLVAALSVGAGAALIVWTGVAAGIGHVLIRQPLLIAHTLGYGVSTAVAGTLLGWLLVHVQAARPGRLGDTLVRLPLVMPPFTFAMVLIILLGHNGLITRYTAVNSGIYGFTGLFLSGTLARMCYAYVSLSTAYSRLDPRMIEAARDLGASPRFVLWRVMFPRLRPTLWSTVLMLTADGITDLANPLVIGTGFPTLATRLVEAVNAEGDLIAAAACAVIMAVPAAVLWWTGSKLQRGRPLRAVTPEARPGGLAGALSVSRRARWTAFGVQSVLAVALGAVCWSSVVVAIGTDHRLTTVHWLHIVDGTYTRALATTALIGALVIPLALGASWLVARAALRDEASVPRLTKIVDGLGAIPGLVAGFGMFLVVQYAASGLRAVDAPPSWSMGLTLLGLVAVQMVMSFPMVGGPVLKTTAQLVPTLRDAAMSLGARPRDIRAALWWPHLREVLADGTVTAFTRCVTAVSSVILLTDSRTPWLTVNLLVAIDAGRLSDAAAMTLALGVMVGIVTRAASSWRSIR